MPKQQGLEAARAAALRKRDAELSDIWEIIHALINAANDAQDVPASCLQMAHAALLRAGRASPGDFTNAQLEAMAAVDDLRTWRSDMGEIYAGELLDHGGETFVVMSGKAHVAQSGLEPGTEGGRTLFRPLRGEPDLDSPDVLAFINGERVPYGAKRRDLGDGRIYTPVQEEGVALEAPHRPGLAPGAYKLVSDTPDEIAGLKGAVPCPAWDDLEENHLFAAGDRFAASGKMWEALRGFTKAEGWMPPTLSGDYYAEI